MSEEVSSTSHDPYYPKVELHFQGIFVRSPFSYTDGITFKFTDVDFVGMDMNECVKFLERFMGETCKKLYYCTPNKPLRFGVRPIEHEGHYAEFMLAAYSIEDYISVFVDHFGEEIDDCFQKDEKEPEEEHTQGGSAPVPMNTQEEETQEEHTQAENTQFNKNCIDDAVDNDDEIPNIMRTRDDPFLSKLCGDNENESKDAGYMDEENGDDSKQVHPTFNEDIPWKTQIPIIGVRFINPAQLKSMLCNYVVANGYQLCYEKNDKKRLLVKCCKGECTFRLWASWMSDEKSFQIKSLHAEHNCARNYKLGSIVTYKWIGSHYTKEIVHRQKMSARKLRLEVIKKFGIHVSIGQCRRAKLHALQLIEGTLVEHYAKLWSYAAEIRRSNPGSTVKLAVERIGDGQNYFSKYYVCFDALKRGWMDGCRRIIGLDGCFLKGFCKGELLTAVGRDANDQIYPIAWAVVCVENKENWKWFLDNLIDDLQLELGSNISLMSDQHKGLIEAVKEVLPYAEHRQCARHICANLQKRFSGAEYETLFWKAAKSTTVEAYNAVMKDLNLVNPQAHQFLLDKNPKTWSLAFFETGRCCDAVENGVCESFNAIISDYRKKPIITMLEEIRLHMMDMLYKMKQKGESWGIQVCQKIRLKLNELKIHQRHWNVQPSGLNQFEVRSTIDAFAVDLEKKTCSCRLWQLNGYGCVHSIACICHLNRDVEAYVDTMFNTTTYKKACKYSIAGMNGCKMWPESSNIPPLPPRTRRMPGRPCVKRKRDATEKASGNKLSKAGKKIKCSICKETGHNKAGCKKDKNDNNEKRRRSKMAVKRGQQPKN